MGGLGVSSASLLALSAFLTSAFCASELLTTVFSETFEDVMFRKALEGHGNKFERMSSNFTFEWTKFEFSKNRNKFELLCSSFERVAVNRSNFSGRKDRGRTF